MKTQEQLIQYFTKKLENVKIMFQGDDRHIEKIHFAECELKAAKQGMDTLKSFWEQHKQECDNNNEAEFLASYAQ